MWIKSVNTHRSDISIFFCHIQSMWLINLQNKKHLHIGSQFIFKFFLCPNLQRFYVFKFITVSLSSTEANNIFMSHAKTALRTLRRISNKQTNHQEALVESVKKPQSWKQAAQGWPYFLSPDGQSLLISTCGHCH